MKTISFSFIRYYYRFIFIVFFSTSAHSQISPQIVANLDFGDSPTATTLELEFSRSNSQENILLVTALNLISDYPEQEAEIVSVEGLDEYTTHLKGWFVVQQQSQELWVGMTIKSGETESIIHLKVPKLLGKIGEYPDENYVLTFSKPSSVLSNLSHGNNAIQYAPIVKIIANDPEWGSIIIEESQSWRKIKHGMYELIFGDSLHLQNSLIIHRESRVFEEWLLTRMGSFFWSLAPGLLVFVVLVEVFGGISKVKPYLGVILFIGGILLYYLGDGWPIHWKKLFFIGTPVIGFLTPALALLLIPSSKFGNISKFVKRLQSRD